MEGQHPEEQQRSEDLLGTEVGATAIIPSTEAAAAVYSPNNNPSSSGVATTVALPSTQASGATHRPSNTPTPSDEEVTHNIRSSDNTVSEAKQLTPKAANSGSDRVHRPERGGEGGGSLEGNQTDQKDTIETPQGETEATDQWENEENTDLERPNDGKDAEATQDEGEEGEGAAKVPEEERTSDRQRESPRMETESLERGGERGEGGGEGKGEGEEEAEETHAEVRERLEHQNNRESAEQFDQAAQLKDEDEDEYAQQEEWEAGAEKEEEGQQEHQDSQSGPRTGTEHQEKPFEGDEQGDKLEEEEMAVEKERTKEEQTQRQIPREAQELRPLQHVEQTQQVSMQENTGANSELPVPKASQDHSKRAEAPTAAAALLTQQHDEEDGRGENQQEREEDGGKENQQEREEEQDETAEASEDDEESTEHKESTPSEVDAPHFSAMELCPVKFYVADVATHSVRTTTLVAVKPFKDKGGPRLRKKKSRKALNPYMSHKDTVIPMSGTPAQNRALVKERDEFLRNLRAEREAAEASKEEAAAVIQVRFREFRARPDKEAVRDEVVRRRKAAKEAMAYGAEEVALMLDALEDHLQETLAAQNSTPYEEKATDYLEDMKRTTRLKQKVKSTKRLEQARRLAAVVSIQRAIRGFLARRALMVMFNLYMHEEGLHALNKVQASFKGYFFRKQLQEEQSRRRDTAACTIQCLVRRFLARCRIHLLRMHVRSILRRHEAAINIQCMYRGFVARKEVHGILSTRLAIKMQAVFRGHRVRAAAKQAAVAAKRIQAVHRGRVARQQAATLRALREERLALEARMAHHRREQEGAAALQAVWRGSKDRQRVRALRHARREASAIVAQSLYRGHKARRYVAARLAEEKQGDASLVIQSALRQHLARQELARRRAAKRADIEAEASIRMQSLARGSLARQEARRRRQAQAEEGAAVEVQRVVRGRLTRLRVEAERARRLAEAAAAAEAAPGRRRRRRRLRGAGSSREGGGTEEKGDSGSARASDAASATASSVGAGSSRREEDGGGGGEGVEGGVEEGGGGGGGGGTSTLLPPVPRPEQRITGTRQGGIAHGGEEPIDEDNEEGRDTQEEGDKE